MSQTKISQTRIQTTAQLRELLKEFDDEVKIYAAFGDELRVEVLFDKKTGKKALLFD